MQCADAGCCCYGLQGNAAKQTVRLAFEKIRGLQLELEDKIKVRGRALGFRLLCSSHISHLHLLQLQLRIACRACW